jgi:hypothetical protein
MSPIDRWRCHPTGRDAAGRSGRAFRRFALEHSCQQRVPRMVDTPMTAGLQREVDRYALKRIAEPMEIAQAILPGQKYQPVHRRDQR